MNEAALDKLAEVAGLLLGLGKSLSGFGSELMKAAGPPLAEVPKDDVPPPKEQEATPLPKLEDVRAVLAEISRTGKTTEMKALLKTFNANKLSDIPAERYPELLAAAEAIRNA